MILRQRKRSVKVKSDEKVTVRTFTEPFIYLLPFILVVSVFMVFPIITVFLNAFLENYDYLANTYTGMGMGNFAALFSDKEFLLSLKNTFLYVAFVVPLYQDNSEIRLKPDPIGLQPLLLAELSPFFAIF